MQILVRIFNDASRTKSHFFLHFRTHIAHNRQRYDNFLNLSATKCENINHTRNFFMERSVDGQFYLYPVASFQNE